MAPAWLSPRRAAGRHGTAGPGRRGQVDEMILKNKRPILPKENRANRFAIFGRGERI
jgi:hypothetical protein